MVRTFQGLVAPSETGRAPGMSMGSLLSRLVLAVQVRRERAMLAGLDMHTLKDMGLSRADVEREVSRSMWDLPGNRLW